MFNPHVHDILDCVTFLPALSPEFQRQPIETEYLRKKIKAKFGLYRYLVPGVQQMQNLQTV